MRTADIMTLDPVTVAPDAPTEHAARLMLKHGFSGLPVVDETDTLVGIVTEADLLRRREAEVVRRRTRWVEWMRERKSAPRDSRATMPRVCDVMSTTVRTATPDMPLEDVIDVMEQYRIKRLPVIDHGKVVGIVSRANLVRALGSIAGLLPPSADSDAAIRARVAHVLDEQEGSPSRFINIIVQGRVVHLWGGVADERQRLAIVTRIKLVPGVTAVRDHLHRTAEAGIVRSAQWPDERPLAAEWAAKE
jgi:CBS domain-containing protein